MCSCVISPLLFLSLKTLVEFDPPVVTFAFDYTVIITLWVPPVVSLEMGFSFSAELKVCAQ